MHQSKTAIYQYIPLTLTSVLTATLLIGCNGETQRVAEPVDRLAPEIETPVSSLTIAPEVAALTTFNDTPAFESVDESGRRFRYVDPEFTPYLRFSVPVDIGGYSLELMLRGRPELLDALHGRAVGNIPFKKELRADNVVLSFESMRSEDVLWQNGRSYIGVQAPKDAFLPDDILELVDFTFRPSL